MLRKTQKKRDRRCNYQNGIPYSHTEFEIKELQKFYLEETYLYLNKTKFPPVGPLIENDFLECIESWKWHKPS